MTTRKKLVTISDLARSYKIDLGGVAKKIKKHDIETVLVINEDGKACQALTNASIKKLEKEEPNLKTIEFDSSKYITINEMADKLDVDSAGLHKAIRKAGYNFTYCRIPTERERTIRREGQDAVVETVVCSGKPKPCLTKKEFEEYRKAKARIRL